MHWAAHGHTAAEIIAGRADAGKPLMGLTSWTGAKPRRSDVEVAKNYLTAEELDTLNRIVSMYLDFAELQALNRKPMYMRDWIAKLDDFLRVSERDILTHAGRVSHEVDPTISTWARWDNGIFTLPFSVTSTDGRTRRANRPLNWSLNTPRKPIVNG